MLLIKWLGIIKVRIYYWLEAIYIINILHRKALMAFSGK